MAPASPCDIPGLGQWIEIPVITMPAAPYRRCARHLRSGARRSPGAPELDKVQGWELVESVGSQVEEAGWARLGAGSTSRRQTGLDRRSDAGDRCRH